MSIDEVVDATGDNLLARLAQYRAAYGHPIHGLHPYPAKYIPQIPRAIIEQHTNERNTVLDPFCGSGTTLVEAALLGRKSVGVDSNPVATLISAAKTSALAPEQLLAGRTLAKRLSTASADDVPALTRPLFEGQDRWFQPDMAAELHWLREQILAVAPPGSDLATFLSCVFSSIITSVSNQDSDTRYKAVDKGLAVGSAIRRFTRRLQSGLDAAADFASSERAKRNRPRVLTMSAAALTAADIDTNSIDLIVTSPPYPNSYDYYLYHKLRMRWLGYDPKDAQDMEIGSRYEHSSRRAPLDSFIHKMAPVMGNLGRILKPSKLAYFIVGDSVLAGKHVNMAEVYADLGGRFGLHLLAQAEHELESVSKAFQATRASAGNSHRHKKMHRILVFESRNSGPSARTRRLAATPTPKRPSQRLSDSVRNGDVIAISSRDDDRHVHSLAAYPSKFIPDIPRWAIESYASPQATVLDPFAGSATTAVEALLAGCNAISYDISPWAALLARAKTTRASATLIADTVACLLAAMKNASSLPAANRLSFDLDDFWFDPKHLVEFARLRKLIDEVSPSDTRDFLNAVLGTTVRGFSYQDMGQLKVKRDPRKVLHGTPSPLVLFRRRLTQAAEQLIKFNARLAEGTSHRVVCASAEDVRDDSAAGTADLVVTSPPYVNAMNYPMSSRYELILLGLVNYDELRTHQARYIGTERVYAREYSNRPKLPLDWSRARELNEKLDTIYSREPKRAYIAYRFFSEMHHALAASLASLRQGGRLVLVAGTNTIRQVPLDTFGILVSMLEDLGAERELTFHYEIVKQSFKLTRHATAGLIPHDGVAVLSKP